MPETLLHYELPENLTAKKLFSKLSKNIDFQIVTQQYTIKTFYDSFDWRLYNANMICEFNHSQTTSHLRLIDKNDGKVLATQEMLEVPHFSSQFNNGRLKKHLEPALEMRALTPLCQLPLEVYRVNILNKEKKTILRLQIDEYEFLTNRISLLPLKGYDKALNKVREILHNALDLKPTHYTALNAALKQQGLKPNSYTSKVVIKLKPEMSVDKASRVIYRHLLQAMQVNEAGTIADIDTEFLHDFRVAVRRTRAGLNQIKNTNTFTDVSQYIDFFAWLGQITGPTRDLDVYLLSYKQYKAALPISIQADIEPLYEFLKAKQVQAQQELADKLKSSKYKKQLASWEHYLQKAETKKSNPKQETITIKELANQRIWKVYSRVLKEGDAISSSTPAEALHDLRKTCKKLRYLMEFFQSLYAEEKIKALIKSLKNFQTVLGDFQDYEIQATKIKHFSEEMMENNVAANTLLAMGVLIQYLESMKGHARDNFSEQFATFKQAKNQAAFKHLFTHKA